MASLLDEQPERTFTHNPGPSLIFYAVCALIAGALILASLGPGIFQGAPKPQAAQSVGATFSYDAKALAAGAETDLDNVTHVVRTFGGAGPEALRIAVLPDRGEPSPASTGVRLLLEPGDAVDLTGAPVIAELHVAPMLHSAAPRLAVSLQEAGPAVWVQQALPDEPGLMRFTLPPTNGPPIALGLRPIAERADYNFGLEIRKIVLRRAS